MKIGRGMAGPGGLNQSSKTAETISNVQTRFDPLAHTPGFAALLHSSGAGGRGASTGASDSRVMLGGGGGRGGEGGEGGAFGLVGLQVCQHPIVFLRRDTSF